MNWKLKMQISGFLCLVMLATGVQTSFAFQRVKKPDQKSLTLSGVVVGPTGAAVENPIIEAIAIQDRGFLEDQVKQLQVESNPDGTFKMSGVMSGCRPVFRITDSANKFVRIIYPDKNDKIKSQPDLGNLKFELEEGTQVRGKVLFNGDPHPGIKVEMSVSFGLTVGANRLISTECEVYTKTKTNKMGEYLFENVPPGKHIYIEVTADNQDRDSKGSISAKAGEVRLIEDAQFVTLNKKISGIVVDTRGRPVKGARVSFYNQSTGQRYKADPAPGQDRNSGYAPASTGLDGRFTASNLPAAKLMLYASPPYDRNPTTGSRRSTGVRARIEVIAGEKDIKIVLDDRLGREVKKRK